MNRYQGNRAKLPIRKVVLLGAFPSHYHRDVLGILSNNVGRITSWNYNLAYGLRDYTDLHEIHFVTTAKELTEPKQIREGKLTIHFYPVKKWLNAVTLFQYDVYRFRKLIRQINPDVVHGIGTEHIYPFVALGSGYPCLVTIHGYCAGILKKDICCSTLLLFSIYELFVLRNAEHFISINPYIRKLLLRHGKKIHKIFEIENAVSDLFFNRQHSKYRAQKILFIGYINKLKGFDTLIDALVKLVETYPDINLTVVAPRTGTRFEKGMIRKISQASLWKNINFIELVSQEQVKGLFDQSALLVLPSRQETAPMVISEAMAAECPVIATKVGGVTYLIQEGSNGLLVHEGDAEEIAKKIDVFLSNPYLRKRLAVNARKFARLHFSCKMVSAKTYRAYKFVFLNEKLK